MDGWHGRSSWRGAWWMEAGTDGAADGWTSSDGWTDRRMHGSHGWRGGGQSPRVGQARPALQDLVCPIKRSQLTDLDRMRPIESGSMVEVRLLEGWSYAQQQAQTFFGANFDAGSDAGLEAAGKDARRAARDYFVYRRLLELPGYPMTWEHAEKVWVGKT